jgi:cytoskeletal protein RodZ
MADEPYAANDNSHYETEFRNESCHNSQSSEVFREFQTLATEIQDSLQGLICFIFRKKSVSQLGEMLKAARENKGISLEEAERVTHIRKHLLEALEENKTKVFPSPVIARGLIRNYARYLDLDPIEALTLYDGKGIVPVKGQRLTPEGIEFMNLSMAPRSIINWELLVSLAIVLVVMGGGGYLAYDFMANGEFIQAEVIIATPTRTPRAAGITEDAAILLPTTTPLPTDTPTPIPPTDTPTPIVYSGVTVELVIQQPSWVQISADDVKVFEGILQVGDRPNWTGQRRVAIRAGNGGGIEVIVNGVSRGLMGAEGQVVDQIWEKVDNPLELTPEPSQGDPLLTPTPTPGGEVNSEIPPAPAE